MDAFGRILAQYGQDATVRGPGGSTVAVRALIQPIRTRRVERDYTPLGQVALGQYLYLGPPEVPVAERTVEWQGKALRAQNSSLVAAAGLVQYQRAVLVEA